MTTKHRVSFCYHYLVTLPITPTLESRPFFLYDSFMPHRTKRRRRRKKTWWLNFWWQMKLGMMFKRSDYAEFPSAYLALSQRSSRGVPALRDFRRGVRAAVWAGGRQGATVPRRSQPQERSMRDPGWSNPR